jgi:hypothetical protein
MNLNCINLKKSKFYIAISNMTVNNSNSKNLNLNPDFGNFPKNTFPRSPAQTPNAGATLAPFLCHANFQNLNS